MAKMIKFGSVLPGAHLYKFIIATGALILGSFMVAGWTATAFTVATSFFTGFLGSWPIGLFGVGAVAAAGLWLGEGMSMPPSQIQAGGKQGGAVVMGNPIMVDPQVAFVQSRVK